MFQCIAQHCHCELMNTEISDIIGFLPSVSGRPIFGLSVPRSVCQNIRYRFGSIPTHDYCEVGS